LNFKDWKNLLEFIPAPFLSIWTKMEQGICKEKIRKFFSFGRGGENKSSFPRRNFATQMRAR